MKSRSQWQNDTDNACSEATDAGSTYVSAMQEKLAAELAVETAQTALRAAESSVASSEIAVESAHDSVSSARSALSDAETSEGRAAARAELSAAQADLDEHRLSEAREAFSKAQGKVCQSKSRLEKLLASACQAREHSADVTIADGPARFSRHFDSARGIWSAEVDFFDVLIEQLEDSLRSLEAAIEEANRHHSSPRIGRRSGGDGVIA